LFERLLAIRNDVGLLAEEYDTRSGRLVGNFPQAFSHLALVNSAQLITLDAAEQVRDSSFPPPSVKSQRA
jgi:GH15 family glucan-1,4-alpha-glucosidase